MEFVQKGALALLQADDIPGGATKYLNEKLGVEQVGYRDRLTVRPPNVNEVTFFRIPDDGQRVIVVTRSARPMPRTESRSGTTTVYAADRNHFVIDFDDVPPLKELLEKLLQDPDVKSQQRRGNEDA